MNAEPLSFVRSRASVCLFLLIVGVGTIVVNVHPALRNYRVIAVMFVPGVSSLIVRTIFREGVYDVSFRLPRHGLRHICVAWAWPLVVLTAAYSVGWNMSGSFAHATCSGNKVVESLLWGTTVGLVPSALTAFGEELGWRGYLITRLANARIPFPTICTSAIWWLWHLPLILEGELLTEVSCRPVGAALFLPTILAVGHVAARLRIASGSIWPAVILHACLNCCMDLTLDPCTIVGVSRIPLTGGSGLCVSAACVVGAALISRLVPPISGESG